MSDSHDIALLTFSAEVLGRVIESSVPEALSLLLQMSRHASPVVREGAVYGMSPHWRGHPDVRARLADMADADASPGVRVAATEALET